MINTTNTSAEDTVAYAMAAKRILLNGKPTTMVALVIRGGDYGAECGSSGRVGNDQTHQAFNSAAEDVVASLKSYMEEGNGEDHRTDD